VSEKKPSPKKRTGGSRGGQRRRGDDRRDDRRGGRRQAGPAGVDETVSELAGPLRKVLDRLPETQRKVLEYRMGLVDGHPHDLGDTARALGLSLSEARDIEKRAFEHIREAIPLQQLQRFLQR
jgi:DNA-directed RNA polymerase specialized sigma24 family protein